MRRPCPYCAEDIKTAAIVCRFCGRDVVPLTATRIEALPLAAPVIQPVRPTPRRPPELDAIFAAEIARAGKISVLTERSTEILPGQASKRPRWRLRRVLGRPSLALAIAASTIVPLGLVAVLVDQGSPRDTGASVATVSRQPDVATPEPRPPMVIPLPPATSSPSPPRASVVPKVQPPQTEPEYKVEEKVDPAEAKVVKEVEAQLEAIKDDRLRGALGKIGLLAQARVCDPLSARVARALDANTALIETLSGGQPDIVALTGKLSRFAATAQKNGRGAPCADVVQMALQQP